MTRANTFSILKKLLPVTSFAFIGSIFLTACTVYQPGFDLKTKAPRSYEISAVTRDISFTPQAWSEDLKADLYLPEREGSLPVVITIHGGGWSGRSRADMTAIAEKLVTRGYAVFNISYRFAPEYTYPAQLHDVQQALRWLDNNAGRYNLDRKRINTWGYSSGAHLAALVAAYDADNSRLPAIRSTVTGGIPADLTRYSSSPIIIPFIGADRHEKPEVYRDASPISHVSADHPPVFLYHGKLDALVEVEQSIDYHQKLEAKGVEAELYLHRLWGHFAMFLLGGDAEAEAIKFLDFHNQQKMSAENGNSGKGKISGKTASASPNL